MKLPTSNTSVNQRNIPFNLTSDWFEGILREESSPSGRANCTAVAREHPTKQETVGARRACHQDVPAESQVDVLVVQTPLCLVYAFLRYEIDCSMFVYFCLLYMHMISVVSLRQGTHLTPLRYFYWYLHLEVTLIFASCSEEFCFQFPSHF